MSAFEECLEDDTGWEMTARFSDGGGAGEGPVSVRGRRGVESRSGLEDRGEEWEEVAAELEAEADCGAG